MRSILGPLVLLLLTAPLPVGIVMTGCAASLPPAVQVPNLKSIAGEWQVFRGASWNEHSRCVVRSMRS